MCRHMSATAGTFVYRKQYAHTTTLLCKDNAQGLRMPIVKP